MQPLINIEERGDTGIAKGAKVEIKAMALAPYPYPRTLIQRAGSALELSDE